ncbi:hypothetical protein BDD12DRAFT_807194 [Trichophaea hybrida]|nr:hypothetical protein BDD12DRAFT_807194 [Trichophaea hybrida]
MGDAVDYQYIYGTERPKNRDRKQSRMRTSFFGGGKRRSLDLIQDATDGPKSPSISQTPIHEAESGSISPSIYNRRRRLRKMSSKSSLSSVTSFTSFSTNSESSNERRSKSRSFQDALFRGGYWSNPTQQFQLTRLKPPISEPFDFTHIVQANPADVSRLRYDNIPKDMGEEWNRALHRESQSRPSTARPFSPLHRRDDSVATIETIRSRSRSGSAGSVPPTESIPESYPTSPTRYACPITPPLRSSSRHCLRIPEHPDEENPEAAKGNNDDVPEDFTVANEAKGDDTVGHAVTTPGDSCFGEKSPGVEKRFCPEPDSLEPTSPGLLTQGDEDSNLPVIRETQSTPELTEPTEDLDTGFRHQLFLSVRSRPLSQMSQLSDTLNGNFVVPPSIVRRGSRRSRRISRNRLSAYIKLQGGSTLDTAVIDSWEEDIDWCYEHEAEADCEFDWEKDSSSEQEPIYQPPRPPSPPIVLDTSVFDFSTPKCELLGIPEEPKEEPILEEKRITGIFEDRLLLPPSPRFAPSSFGFPGSQRGRDSGFESDHLDDQSLLMRAGNTAVRHRSISSSPSLADLIPGRSYREELCRVARQLDEHIAALNKECYFPPSTVQPIHPQSTIPTRKASITENIKTFTGKRPRADSQVTCVTLCSDTDTITPIETNEVITPSGSAHNSFHFSRQRASSVSGAGFAVEGRLDKGLSFPAAAIPGVVELAPDELHDMCSGETEFVHYI